MLQCADARFYCNTAAASFGTKLQTGVLSLQRDDTSALVFMKEGCLDKEEEDGTGVALFVAAFVVIRLNHFLSVPTSLSLLILHPCLHILFFSLFWLLALSTVSRFSIHVFSLFSFLYLIFILLLLWPASFN